MTTPREPTTAEVRACIRLHDGDTISDRLRAELPSPPAEEVPDAATS